MTENLFAKATALLADAFRKVDASRTCKSCKGSGEYVQKGFQGESRWWPEVRKPCSSCAGRGHLDAPDVAAIMAAIVGRGGKTLRSARPKDPRAYYVWRNARFHGGADVTMPIMASLEVHGDPFQPELDALADVAARLAFGTDLAAAHRWGTAFGIVKDEVPGLPETAYSGGRVLIGAKPESEAAEIEDAVDRCGDPLTESGRDHDDPAEVAFRLSTLRRRA